MKILVINGPNLQLLGSREADIYGKTTLAAIIGSLKEEGERAGVEILDYQSNSEGSLCDRIALAGAEKADGIIINAGAYTHYSIAMLDALKAVDIPYIEVHLSNVYRREEFRHHSLLAASAAGVIAGFGADSYNLALKAMLGLIAKSKQKES